MTKSNREKQSDFRARKEMLGLSEVRGVWLPAKLHAKIKEYARWLLDRARSI